MNLSFLKIKSWAKWLLLVVILAYIITGFGMTQFRIVEPLTLGLLSKNLAFKIHHTLIIPLIVLLIIHIYKKS